MHILNIGHKIAGTDQSLTLTQIVQAVERAGLRIARLDVHTSDTETTSVISTPDWDSPAVFGLSRVLGQDCIACWHPLRPGQPGELVGPEAAAWGAFNPAFFLMPDGFRLATFLPLLADEVAA